MPPTSRKSSKQKKPTSLQNALEYSSIRRELDDHMIDCQEINDRDQDILQGDCLTEDERKIAAQYTYECLVETAAELKAAELQKYLKPGEWSQLISEFQHLFSDTDIPELRKNFHQAQDKFDRAQTTISRLENDNQRLQKLADRTKTAHDQNTFLTKELTKSQSTASELRLQLTSLQQDLITLRRKSERQSTQITGFEAELSSTRTTVENVQSEKKRLEQNLGQIKTSVEQAKKKYNAKINTLELQVKKRQEGFEGAKQEHGQELTKLERQVQKLSDQLDAKTGDLQSAEDQYTDLDFRCRDLAKDNLEKTSRIVELTEDIKELDNDKERFRLQAKGLTNQVGELNDQILRGNNTLCENHNLINSTNALLDASRADVRSLRAQLESLEHNVKLKDCEIERLSSDHDQDKRQIDQLRLNFELQSAIVYEQTCDLEKSANTIEELKDVAQSSAEEIQQLQVGATDGQQQIRRLEEELFKNTEAATDSTVQLHHSANSIKCLKTEIEGKDAAIETLTIDNSFLIEQKRSLEETLGSSIKMARTNGETSSYLQTVIDAKQEEITRLRADKHRLESEASQLRRTANSSAQRVEDLERSEKAAHDITLQVMGERDSFQEALQTATKQKDRYREELDEALKEFNHENEARVILAREKPVLEQKILRLEIDIDVDKTAHNREKDKLQREIRQLQNELMWLNDLIETGSPLSQDLEAALYTQTEANKQLSLEIHHLRLVEEENAAEEMLRERFLGSLQQENSALAQEVMQTDDKALALQQNLDTTKGQLEGLRTVEADLQRANSTIESLQASVEDLTTRFENMSLSQSESAQQTLTAIRTGCGGHYGSSENLNLTLLTHVYGIDCSTANVVQIIPQKPLGIHLRAEIRDTGDISMLLVAVNYYLTVSVQSDMPQDLTNTLLGFWTDLNKSSPPNLGIRQVSANAVLSTLQAVLEKWQVHFQRSFSVVCWLLIEVSVLMALSIYPTNTTARISVLIDEILSAKINMLQAAALIRLKSAIQQQPLEYVKACEMARDDFDAQDGLVCEVVTGSSILVIIQLGEMAVMLVEQNKLESIEFGYMEGFVSIGIGWQQNLEFDRGILSTPISTRAEWWLSLRAWFNSRNAVPKRVVLEK